MGQSETSSGFDQECIRKATRLSRLKLTDSEVTELLPQLEQILAYVDQLRTIPTDGVQPLIHPLLELVPGVETSSLRPDQARAVSSENQTSAAILECAPELTDRAFQVPQAVFQSGGRSQ